MPNSIKHRLLKNALDDIAKIAPANFTIYHPSSSNEDAQIHKYSRSQIHLFLRVRYGILDFNSVEEQITDGTNDGGLDAYHIDDNQKTIYLIQSKYKTTPDGYMNKDVDWREFFKMDLGRITQGEATSESGHEYNGKIAGFQRKIAEIPDIARWKYTLVYLGNVPSAIDDRSLLKISGGVCQDVEILHGDVFYSKILVPYLKRDFYNKDDFSFEIQVNQDRSANRIRYSVDLSGDNSAEVQLCFVPTLEIGKIMSQYRNSILQYNPRCYVGIKNTGVNADIRDSILHTDHNEFSLLNNGLTIVCKAVSYNDNTGRQGKASITVSNPQIVNGGQTAFTLAHIYESDTKKAMLNNKEVLTKFIIIEGNQEEMIEKISNSTNNQTPVRPRDRVSNDLEVMHLQSDLFDKYGILLERKQGEFYDAIKNKITAKGDIFDLVTLMRLTLVSRGHVARARSASESVLFKDYNLDGIDAGRARMLINIYARVSNLSKKSKKDGDEQYDMQVWGSGLRYGQFAIIYAVDSLSDAIEDIDNNLAKVQAKWLDFEVTISNHEHNKSYFSDGFDYANYYKGRTVNQDLRTYIDTILRE